MRYFIKTHPHVSIINKKKWGSSLGENTGSFLVRELPSAIATALIVGYLETWSKCPPPPPPPGKPARVPEQ